MGCRTCSAPEEHGYFVISRFGDFVIANHQIAKSQNRQITKWEIRTTILGPIHAEKWVRDTTANPDFRPILTGENVGDVLLSFASQLLQASAL